MILPRLFTVFGGARTFWRADLSATLTAHFEDIMSDASHVFIGTRLCQHLGFQHALSGLAVKSPGEIKLACFRNAGRLWGDVSIKFF